MTAHDSHAVREHYDRNIDEYDLLHGNAQDPEHVKALDAFWRFVRPHVGVESALDVGCGTGRGLEWFARNDPTITLTGIDPSIEMCARAAARVPQAHIAVGDGAHLDFPDGAFDLVIATGILHHIADTGPVLRELFRVARKAVLVSDHNDFAMGSMLSRRIRLVLHTLGLLRPVNYLRQGFRHRRFSREDGWYYHYSIFDDYQFFSENANEVIIIPTRIRGMPAGQSLVMRQSHLCLVGIK